MGSNVRTLRIKSQYMRRDVKSAAISVLRNFEPPARFTNAAKQLFLLRDSLESRNQRAQTVERSNPPKSKTQQNQSSVVLRLTKPRRELKADAALLIKGVNRWRTD
jgi:hypothetical protein